MARPMRIATAALATVAVAGAATVGAAGAGGFLIMSRAATAAR
jgi:hypothetical protein